MRVKILGQYWPLLFRRLRGQASGWCYSDDKASERKLLIDTQLRDREELRVLLHELQHAFNPEASEEWVDQVSTELSDILWRIGYRRKKESPRVAR